MKCNGGTSICFYPPLVQSTGLDPFSPQFSLECSAFQQIIVSSSVVERFFGCLQVTRATAIYAKQQKILMEFGCTRQEHMQKTY